MSSYLNQPYRYQKTQPRHFKQHQLHQYETPPKWLKTHLTDQENDHLHELVYTSIRQGTLLSFVMCYLRLGIVDSQKI